MKKLLTVKTGIFISILLISSLAAMGQGTGLQAKVKEIQLSIPSEVEASKLTFQQEVTSTSSGYLEYSVTEVNDKGRAEQRIYSFGLSDINEKSIRSFTDKDLMLVEIRTSGNQKLIKRSLENGNKIDYIADFKMYARNAENGRSLKKAFEDAIPVAREVEQRGLNLNTYEEHLKWLEAHIANVALPKKEIGQQFTADRSKPGTVMLERVRGSKKEQFVFNLSQLNPISVKYDVSGSLFSIDIGTKNNVNGVKYFEQDVPRDFKNRVTFYASSMANGKRIQRVLKGIVPLAEGYVERSEPKFSASTQALEYLNTNMANVALEEGTVTQKIDLEDNLTTISTTLTNTKKTLDNQYIFDISDINPRGISYHNDGASLFLELHTKNERPLIRHIENGVPRNFRKYIRLYFESIDDERVAEKALIFLIQRNEDKLTVKKNVTGIPFYDGLEELKATIGAVDNGEIQYDQKIGLLNRTMSAFTLSKTISDPKNTRETVYEFSTRDLNRNNMRIEVSGTRVWVELGTLNSQKVVKLFKDGKVQNYQSIIQIEASDTSNAKEIMAIFKQLEDLQTE